MKTGLPALRRLPAAWPGSAIGLALLAAGCGSVGPGSIGRDRLGYTEAVGNSWTNQTLLNIVRLRYGEAPVFLDVSSIIGGYGVQATATAAAIASTDRTASVPYGTERQ